jgi:hypothetical protein
MTKTTPLQALIATPTFEAQARTAGVSEEEMKEICDVIAGDPQAGDLISGTGGARKLRHRRAGTGKSGGYRTIHYWGGDDVPVFLLAIYGKSQKDNLSKEERNTLKKILPLLADAYRESVRNATRGA